MFENSRQVKRPQNFIFGGGAGDFNNIINYFRPTLKNAIFRFGEIKQSLIFFCFKKKSTFFFNWKCNFHDIKILKTHFLKEKKI